MKKIYNWMTASAPLGAITAAATMPNSIEEFGYGLLVGMAFWMCMLAPMLSEE
jgi:hypothetical protein